MTQFLAPFRWVLVTVVAYCGVGLVVWVAAMVRHPAAFGPIEWLMTLVWYVIAWPVYVPLLLRD